MKSDSEKGDAMNLFLEMMVKLKLKKTFTPNPDRARIDGVVLFSHDYRDPAKIAGIRKIFEKKAGGKVMLRIPLCAPELFAEFKTVATIANSNRLEVAALLDDRPGDGSSIMKRLSLIKTGTPFVKHIELFNELPHMSYNGQPIASCDDLIRLTNQYTDWIHQNIPGCAVVSMAPYNNLDQRTHKEWNISNWDILKRLALEARVDCTAIHCYGMETRHRTKLAELAKALDEWHGEYERKYGLRKRIWVTECGSGDRRIDEEYFRDWTSVFAEHLKAEKILWYRMSIERPDENEANFAMEIRATGETSPLIRTLQA